MRRSMSASSEPAMRTPSWYTSSWKIAKFDQRFHESSISDVAVRLSNCKCFSYLFLTYLQLLIYIFV